jgi:hypothetical protein
MPSEPREAARTSTQCSLRCRAGRGKQPVGREQPTVAAWLWRKPTPYAVRERSTEGAPKWSGSGDAVSVAGLAAGFLARGQRGFEGWRPSGPEPVTAVEVIEPAWHTCPNGCGWQSLDGPVDPRTCPVCNPRGPTGREVVWIGLLFSETSGPRCQSHTTVRP